MPSSLAVGMCAMPCSVILHLTFMQNSVSLFFFLPADAVTWAGAFRLLLVTLGGVPMIAVVLWATPWMPPTSLLLLAAAVAPAWSCGSVTSKDTTELTGSAADATEATGGTDRTEATSGTEEGGDATASAASFNSRSCCLTLSALVWHLEPPLTDSISFWGFRAGAVHQEEFFFGRCAALFTFSINFSQKPPSANASSRSKTLNASSFEACLREVI